MDSVPTQKYTMQKELGMRQRRERSRRVGREWGRRVQETGRETLTVDGEE